MCFPRVRFEKIKMLDVKDLIMALVRGWRERFHWPHRKEVQSACHVNLFHVFGLIVLSAVLFLLMRRM